MFCGAHEVPFGSCPSRQTGLAQLSPGTPHTGQTESSLILALAAKLGRVRKQISNAYRTCAALGMSTNLPVIFTVLPGTSGQVKRLKSLPLGQKAIATAASILNRSNQATNPFLRQRVGRLTWSAVPERRNHTV
jgi:hypothetical protein